MKKSTGFTLIELLVVVLIIGILAAVALPQYQKAVEKARMMEAITFVRAIANAHQVFYMANGRYLAQNEIELLDIEVPGSIFQGSSIHPGRIQTKDFIYSPNSDHNNELADAQRVPFSACYRIFIRQNSPDRIRCTTYGNQETAIQKELCNQLDTKGTL